MTDRLTEIEQRLERITNGKWISTCDPDAGSYSWTVATFGESGIDYKRYEVAAQGPHASEVNGDAKYDAEFVASAPTDISYLLGEVKRLQQVEKESESAIDDLIKTRDENEEYITYLAIRLGCREEWSNLHSHWHCVPELIAELEKPETL